jgi:tetratricopeptide (TPR) repeat protein
MGLIRRQRLHFLLGIALAFVARGVCADAPPALRGDPEKLLGFAHHLSGEGDAYRAVTEYRAFLFLHPGHSKEREAWFFLGKALQQEREWDQALEAFLRTAEGDGGNGPWAEAAVLEYGETLLRAGQPAAAARALEEVADSPRWKLIRGKALYRAAWAWMQSREWGRADRALERIPPDDPLGRAAEERREEIARDVFSLPRRDSLLAGGLAAVLPGSGHLYCGRIKEALTSFLLNGVFIAGAVFAIREGYPISGGILSFFELGWYLGGIESASQAAERFNREQESQWLKRGEAQWETPLYGAGSGGAAPMLRWEWRF